MVSKDDAARALGVSLMTIDFWRSRGMPCLLIDGVPRFDLAACLRWLEGEARG